MDETMPDASPLSQRFLASLASFMEREHEVMGEGDISSQVKVAIAPQASEGIAESKTTPEAASIPADNSSQDGHSSN